MIRDNALARQVGTFHLRDNFVPVPCQFTRCCLIACDDQSPTYTAADMEDLVKIATSNGMTLASNYRDNDDGTFVQPVSKP